MKRLLVSCKEAMLYVYRTAIRSKWWNIQEVMYGREHGRYRSKGEH